MTVDATIAARRLYTGERWVRDAVVHLKDGAITRVDEGCVVADAWDVVVPAWHNAHSHAFQWAMRGEGQARSVERPHDDFWSWRERMYGLAASLTPDDVEEIATGAYREMVSAGYATVGEFHYLHHGVDGGVTHEMALAHVRAARAAGIRLVLLPVAYARAGAGRPPAGAQLRFAHESAEAFLARVDELRDVAGVPVCAGVHSVRAVPRPWVEAVAAWSAREGQVLHVHASEQRRELAECIAEHGMTPIRLLDECGALTERTVLVHATHLDAGELDLIAARGAMVCACPTTERDLGDGFLEGRRMLELGIGVCIGSDSHTLIDAREELRLLEYHERLRYEQRAVLTLPERGVLRPAQTLLRWGSEVGARALGVASGRIEPGRRGDLVALSVPVSGDEGWAPLERWLFSTPARDIAQVWVDGVARKDAVRR